MKHFLRSIDEWIPVAMSLAALIVVASHLCLAGSRPEADEGTAAHLFQLCIAGQLPLILIALFRGFPRWPRRAAAVLGVQLLAMGVALAPVYYHHL